MSGGQIWQRLKGSFLRLPRTVKCLVAIQAVLYLAALAFGDSAAYGTFVEYVALVPKEVLSGKVWTLVTYMPFHLRPDALGLLFDIFVLWSLGGIFAHRWRETHFLFFYLAGGLGGALAEILLYLVLPDRFGHVAMGTAGCSFALLAAFWLILGEGMVSLLGSKPFKGKWVFYGLIALETLFFLSGTNPDFGIQLGGVAMGWLLATGRWRPRKLKSYIAGLLGRGRRAARDRQKKRFRVVH